MKIHPADHMRASVSYSGATHKFTESLKDLTTGASFTKTQAVPTAVRESAEWVAFDPASGSALYPLTNFGWVTFANCSATIGGHSRAIGGFPNIELTMVKRIGVGVKASVGGLNPAGNGFRVTWKAHGP
jgi:Peptidase A4 family